MPRFPRIGRLRQRVTIQSRADSESGLYSGISTRTTKVTVWAKVEMSQEHSRLIHAMREQAYRT
jgi:head-tail adaptor